MELKEFVSATLTSIVEGVADAQQSGLGAHINPQRSQFKASGDGEFTTNYGLVASPVQFDVAVTVTDTGSAAGGGKVSIWAVSANANASSVNEKQSASRVRFSVPISLPPIDKNPHD